MARPPLFHRNRPRVLNRVNDNYCVKCAIGLKDCVCVPGQLGLNPSPVTSKSETIFTCKLLCCKCSFCYWVATKERHKSQATMSIHKDSPTFWRQCISNCCQNYTEISNYVNYCVKCAIGLKDCVCVPGQLGLNPSPVTSKSETIFTCKLLCCKCSFCHWVATKERHKSQATMSIHKDSPTFWRHCISNCCQNYTEIKYVKDVSCVGHLNKFPNCCYKSTCRDKVTSIFWVRVQKW